MKFISILLVLSQLSAIAATHQKAAAHHSNNKKNEAAAKVVTEKFSEMMKEKFNEIKKEYGHEGHKDIREKVLSRVVNARKKAPMSKEAVEKNRKLTHEMSSYSVSRYSTSGRDCTGQVMVAKGHLDGQPGAKETLRQSDLNQCEWFEEDGKYAMFEAAECIDDGDFYTESIKISIFNDHDCKDLLTTVWDSETLPKCENYMDKETGTKAIITQCSANPTPMNNFKGIYYFMYPPGTCGTKSFPIAYYSAILEDFCYPINSTEVYVGGKYLTGAKLKYNPTSNVIDYNMYYKDVPMDYTGKEILNNLGYNGGDPCDGYMEKFFEAGFDEVLDVIHECIQVDNETYYDSSVQYINGDGRITTRHTGRGGV